ncbi:MAG TPA: hypothetical protein VFH78_13720 [Candidatus Thermoplasmatota archaeon]|nr:hypothetical protein [Candidatus Thermoplasmatota archaeon]
MAERWYEGRFAIAAQALVLALPLVGVKYAVHHMGWERIDTLVLATSLLGGVIFTLAIILAGVLADFKDSERLLSELASTFRRLHADLALLAQGDRLAQMRRELLASASAVAEDLRRGDRIRTARAFAPLERLDLLVLEAARAPVAAGMLSTIQSNITTVVRDTDRLRTIMETTFLRAGYAFAGLAVTGALAVLTLARIPGLGAALALHFFASFLLVGLLLLIYDLDNPFQGAVRASTRSMDEVEAWLRDGPESVPVVATAR